MAGVSGIGVLDKAMILLDIVEREPRSVADFIEATGWSRATCSRLTLGLERHGLLARNRESQLVLGPRLIGVTLAQRCLSTLTWMRDETGESAQLFVRRGKERMCVSAVHSTQELRTIIEPGTLMPLEVGSAGHVLSKDEDVLARGWSATVGERSRGTASVSAPIRYGDDVVAAVCLSGPVERVGIHPGARYAKIVVAAAAALERMLDADAFEALSIDPSLDVSDG